MSMCEVTINVLPIGLDGRLHDISNLCRHLLVNCSRDMTSCSILEKFFNALVSIVMCQN